MRVPTLTWWPGTIQGGTTTNAIGVTTDLLPTFAKLTGSKIPNDRKIDGKNIDGILLGKKGVKSPHKIHYYEVDGIRKGDWKLVKKKVKGKIIRELYDLSKDLGEKKDLAEKMPKMVEELDQLLEQHAASIAGNLRPPAYSKNPKPILKEVGNLPTLREYLKK
jgi:arylsulfatase A-like enzyme